MRERPEETWVSYFLKGEIIMGCDIHTHVEFRRGHRDGSKCKWQCGDYFSTIDPLDPDAKFVIQELCGDRNYSLFAVLADVRNDGYDYIDEPRGLPDDVTEFVKKDYETWGWDAHSCSYFTLRELIEYHDEYKPKDIYGHDILLPLINELKRRADEFHFIYEFSWDGTRRDEAMQKAEDIRFIFWFDN